MANSIRTPLKTFAAKEGGALLKGTDLSSVGLATATKLSRGRRSG